MKYSKVAFVLLIINLISSIFSFRFATYNIQSGSNFEHVYNLTETAEAIKQLNVDFIALQEVDNMTTRHPVDQTTYIARYNEQQPFQFYHFEKMRDFQNGGYGISILAREAAVKRVFTYHYNSTTPEQCLVPKDGDYCQGFVLFEMPFKLRDSTEYSVYFGTTHLGIGLSGMQQLTEAKQIVQWTKENIVEVSQTPYIILMTGDFNTIPSDASIKDVMLSLFEDLWMADDVCRKIVDPSNVNGYTFDALNPSKRIDYFFMLKSSDFPDQIKLDCEMQVVPTLSSDHRPVVMKFDLSEQ
jgi:endonuclease/exonuclease/phosphatase family metal-dependent hydrolase